MNEKNFKDLIKKAIEIADQCSDITHYGVGCLIVDKDLKILSTGYTNELSGKHAEEIAIGKLNRISYSDCILVSTLEPCSTRLSGKRSCSSRIIEKSFHAVIYGVNEPSEFVKCTGAIDLAEAGIKVYQVKDLEQECLESITKNRKGEN